MTDGTFSPLDYLLPPSDGISIFTWSSLKLGCHEAGLRLIFSLVFVYPLCIVYNIVFSKQPLVIKHLYLFLSGLSVGYFNYGFDIFHTFGTILFVYIVHNIFGGKRISVVINFTFCMSYLMWGYYLTQTDEYAFEWTIPQCVLTLRLIAFTFDVYDGHQLTKLEKKEDVDKGLASAKIDNPEALQKLPTLLELLSHCYFPGSCLVGPQFGCRRYLNFIELPENHLPICFIPGLKRLGLGLLYLGVFQMGSLYWPLDYLTSTKFEELSSFWLKFVQITVVMKIQLCKYVAIWLLSEGCCVMSGITYDKEKKTFDSCSNIDVWGFESSTTFGGLIKAFNKTTNAFAAKYIFKRLKFLGSKTISHFVTLIFLAMWHGWKSGYYNCFVMEFLIMKMEWEVLALLKSIRSQYKGVDRFLSAFYVRWPLKIFFHLYTVSMLCYCLTSFILLTSSKWYPLLSQIYFCGHIVYTSWLFVSLLL